MSLPVSFKGYAVVISYYKGVCTLNHDRKTAILVPISCLSIYRPKLIRKL